MKSYILKLLGGISSKLIVFLVAMLPIFELRGAIPLGIILYKLPPLPVFSLAVIGNLVPLVPILLFLDPVSRFFRRFEIFDRFFDWLFARTRKRSKLIERLELIGLVLFVAIPLPMTGGWTGSVAAFLFDFRFWESLLAICVGVIIAGIIVSLVSMGIIHIPFII